MTADRAPSHTQLLALLDMDKMAVFVVGDWDTIAPGDPTGRAKMADFFKDQAEHLPLRDPLTMQPMK